MMTKYTIQARRSQVGEPNVENVYDILKQGNRIGTIFDQAEANSILTAIRMQEFGEIK